MGPEQWKGERQEQEGGEPRPAAREATEDEREEEGWSQPESSAVKAPPMPETEQPGGE